ncbi:MAG: hypothetical protein QM743_10385 [Chitinophagaceae bacterium]
MKLLLRFLLSLSLIFFGNSSPLGAQQHPDGGRHILVNLPERIDNTRVFTILDLPLSELRTVLSANHRGHEEIVTSDNESEDDEDDEEFQSFKKSPGADNYFTSFFYTSQQPFTADLSLLRWLEILQQI